MAEWFKVAVLKTVGLEGPMGSNPILSTKSNYIKDGKYLMNRNIGYFKKQFS